MALHRSKALPHDSKLSASFSRGLHELCTHKHLHHISPCIISAHINSFMDTIQIHVYLFGLKFDSTYHAEWRRSCPMGSSSGHSYRENPSNQHITSTSSSSTSAIVLGRCVGPVGPSGWKLKDRACKPIETPTRNPFRFIHQKIAAF